MLVADDNADTLITMAEVIRLGGHEVHVCLDGVQVMLLVRQSDPDCVLLDINLPGINGWELASRIRALPSRRKRLLIAVSGEYMNESDTVLGKMRGFDHYLMKPADPAAILALLNGHSKTL